MNKQTALYHKQDAVYQFNREGSISTCSETLIRAFLIKSVVSVVLQLT